jgi:hypothetical protein
MLRSMPRAMVAGCLSAGVALFATLPGSALGASPCGTGGVFARAGVTATCTYTTPGEDTFAVPSAISSLQVVAVGGTGGAGGNAATQSNGGAGGDGAQVTASVSVAPSSTLYVEVGSNGAPGTSGHAGANVCPGGAAGGNGGGQGGDGRCEFGGRGRRRRRLRCPDVAGVGGWPDGGDG